MYNVISSSKPGFLQADLQSLSANDLLDKLSEILADQYSIFLNTPPGTPPPPPPTSVPVAETYSELLEDGKFDRPDIWSERDKRVSNLRIKFEDNLNTNITSKYNNFASDADKENAVKDSMDLLLEDLREIMINRQSHRVANHAARGIVKKTIIGKYNTTKKWLKDHPYIRVSSKVVLIGALALLPITGGLSLGTNIAIGAASGVAGFRKAASRALVGLRSRQSFDNFRSLAVMQQKEIRNTITANAPGSEYGTYKKKAQTIELNLKARVYTQVLNSLHRTPPPTPDEIKQEILDTLVQEHKNALAEMEQERRILNRVRAGELLGAAAAGAVVRLGIQAMLAGPSGGGGGTPPDPSGGGGTPPDPSGGGGTPPDPSGGGDTPEPPTITKIPTYNFSGEFSTATRLYDPTHSIVDSTDITDMTKLNYSATGAPSKGKILDVFVNTADSGSAGKLLLRDPNNAANIIGKLNPGEKLQILFEDPGSAYITDGSGSTTKMPMFKALDSNGKVRGIVSGAFLKKL